MYIEELSREKVLRDPVHDYIHIQHRVILDLINSREMQRLRRIKQQALLCSPSILLNIPAFLIH